MDGDASTRLGLPYLAAGQLQKHVTLNEALTRLDALLQTAVVSRTTTAQPATSADGDLYILPEGATGFFWATCEAGDLLRAETGGWVVVTAPEGMIAVVLDAGEVVVRKAGEWISLGALLSSVQDLALLGLGTTADAGNPFSAKLNKALWTALETAYGGDGDLRVTFNKEGPADVLSLLFQSGYGGRAELGLIGGDDLSLKVSADGGTWREAFAVDRATGRVTFGQGSARIETTTFTTGGTYAVPVWARVLEVVCIGGGAGGGSGMPGAAGTARHGGGGGGAGGVSSARWSTADLAASLTIAVGGGGAGGAGVGSGPGTAGAVGGSSSMSSTGAIILTGAGGLGGAGGGAASGLGGAGGAGLPASNKGGDSAVTATAFAGEALARPDASGGGGGGGGVSTANVARAGGPGGAGGSLTVAVAGGAGGAVGAVGQPGQASSLPNLSCAASGGGGGGAHASAAGRAGGGGAAFGAGGGGGGAGVTASGAGGAGGAGLVRITAIG